MRVVIDTNCFLAIIPKVSPFRYVFDEYRSNRFELVVTTEILNEYSEIFTSKMSTEISDNIIELIINQSNTIFSDIYFRWNLISADPDDNKFVDAAIVSQSDFLITNDAHFNILKEVSFPKVVVLTIEDICKILKDK